MECPEGGEASTGDPEDSRAMHSTWPDLTPPAKETHFKIGGSSPQRAADIQHMSSSSFSCILTFQEVHRLAVSILKEWDRWSEGMVSHSPV